jgi:hypothetical protein
VCVCVVTCTIIVATIRPLCFVIMCIFTCYLHYEDDYIVVYMLLYDIEASIRYAFVTVL